MSFASCACRAFWANISSSSDVSFFLFRIFAFRARSREAACLAEISPSSSSGDERASDSESDRSAVRMRVFWKLEVRVQLINDIVIGRNNRILGLGVGPEVLTFLRAFFILRALFVGLLSLLLAFSLLCNLPNEESIEFSVR